MNMNDLINDFSEEKECEYKGRTYLVRDNGAVFRLPKEGTRASKLDNEWTFGKESMSCGYMIFTGDIRVHQIVCTAFHGAPSRPNLVVDHIDTNRRNNRPENLRWVTRLENALENEITRKKIIYYCGSIEAFLNNPSLLKKANLNPNFEWMKTVTKEEAEICKRNLERWAQEPSNPNPRHQCQMGDLLLQETHETTETTMDFTAEINPQELNPILFTESRTYGAIQYDWNTPTNFPLCPQMTTEKLLSEYLTNLKKGELFSFNQFTAGVVKDFGYNNSEDAIYVLTIHKSTPSEEDADYGLCKIFIKDDLFVHENIRMYKSETGGLKYFTLAMGREWTGGDCVDDYC